ncbi:HNH endonuclease [Mumia zhuanghuii]|uniref:HNH endonuclease signature motif containing protein n=2 Tax=Mumia TaxID=1546255 RepID=A0ABW1QKQ1_9ACTN|nr:MULTISPECIES: HNH endonuclease signature motif containing protein [Mumia]KAA1423387.1 HNH endonuclease [Mumia zhuanghuii]
MIDTSASVADPTPPDGRADGTVADALLDALSARVAEVVSRARVAVAEAHESHLAAGAAEVEAISTFETVVRIAQGLQHDAVSALEERRSATDSDHSSRGNQGRARSLRAEVGLARGVGNGAGQHTLDVAIALREHPFTHVLLRDGAISSTVAAAVCAETATLDRRLRRRVDELVATSLPGMSAREASAAARRHALALDADGAAARAEAARATRHIRLRRLSDAMAELTVRAPAEQVIAAWRRLQKEAFALASSTGRTTRQIAADVAIEALTGVAVDTSDGASTHLPAEIGLLMRPETLFGVEDTPGVLDGYGPVPAALCRRLAGREASWLRRLFTDDHGDPRDSDARRRRFPARLARLIRATDSQCLRPYCDCDTSEIDHVEQHSRGGLTTRVNAQGACRHDNLVKEGHGWKVRASMVGTDATSLPSSVTWTTPTGHDYTAVRRHRDGRGPTLIARRRPPAELSTAEIHLHDFIRTHRPDRR